MCSPSFHIYVVRKHIVFLGILVEAKMQTLFWIMQLRLQFIYFNTKALQKLRQAIHSSTLR